MLKGHKKTYCDAMGYIEGDFIPCEVCGSEGHEIHHIKARQMGGTTDPYKNSIFNLMCLCRNCHEEYGDKKQYMHPLFMKHMKAVIDRMKKATGLFKQVNFIEYENKIEFIDSK